MSGSCWETLLHVPFELKYYNVNGLRTRVLEAGSGPALIFMHGTGGHLEAYVRNIEAHARHFRVLVPDLLGHGYTEGPAEVNLTLPLYVDHLRGLMDAAGIEKAHLSGESLGGWIAAWFAAEYPDRVLRIVLNTPGGLSANPEVMARLYSLSKQAVVEATRESVRKRLEWLMYDPALVTDELVETRYKIYTMPKTRAAVEQVLCLQTMEIREQNLLTPERLARVKAPTLLVWTSHDPTADLSVGRKFKSMMPGSRLVCIDGCGHWPQFEKPEIFNNLHLAFLTDGTVKVDGSAAVEI